MLTQVSLFGAQQIRAAGGGLVLPSAPRSPILLRHSPTQLPSPSPQYPCLKGATESRSTLLCRSQPTHSSSGLGIQAHKNPRSELLHLLGWCLCESRAERAHSLAGFPVPAGNAHGPGLRLHGHPLRDIHSLHFQKSSDKVNWGWVWEMAAAPSASSVPPFRSPHLQPPPSFPH